VYAKKELVMEKGRIALEVCPQLRIAAEVIQVCVNG
jgi:hypothetical protein